MSEKFQKMIYLDNAATSMVFEDLLEKFKEHSLRYFANPSAGYSQAREAKQALQHARERIGSFLEVPPSSLFFTATGSESNNIVISSFGRKHPKGQVIIGGLEHSAIQKPAKRLQEVGYSIKVAPVTPSGRIDLNKLERLLQEPTSLLCVMAVNNEIGSIQPLSEISQLVERHRRETYPEIHFHCDAVQALGKLSSLSLKDLEIDSAAFSGHKIGTPRGVGLLYLKKTLQPIYEGGGQERGVRPGTEATALCVTLADAVEQLSEKREERIRKLSHLNATLLRGVRESHRLSLVPESREESPEKYVDGIVALAVKGVPGEVITRLLAEKNILVGTGSSCHSNHQKQRQPLSQIVEKERLDSLIRISFDERVEEEEITHLLEAVEESCRLILNE